MIQSHHIYPKEITRFDGIRNTIVTRCFILQAENERTLFLFFNVGSIRLKPINLIVLVINDENIIKRANPISTDDFTGFVFFIAAKHFAFLCANTNTKSTHAIAFKITS